MFYCILIAAFITALIHSSSATIGIVMGLGSAGVLDWQTAVAFSLGADLGTTITSWMASLNLSKNAKRAAYAHISFNIIGVAVMLPLFFPSMLVLAYVMQWFGGDPGIPVMVNGKETFPLVPVAIGLYSTFFNIFNTAILFPFVGVFERVLLQVGKDVSDDFEDFSTPRHLNPNYAKDPAQALPAIQRETARYLDAAVLFLDIARQHPNAPDDSVEHSEAIDVLSREIRTYTAGLFDPSMPHDRADLVASLIEEEDFSASLGESLYQIARRVERHPFSDPGRKLVNEMLDLLAQEMSIIVPGVAKGGAPALADNDARLRCAGRSARPHHQDGGSILGRPGRHPRAARQRRARLLPDRPHPRGAAFGAARGDGERHQGQHRAGRLRPGRCRSGRVRTGHDLTIQQTQRPCRSGSAPVSKPHIPACAGGAR